MTLDEAIRARRSIRKFKAGAPVGREQVRAMLEAAMLAPSAMNLRPWEFVVVEDRKALDRLEKAHPYAGMLKTASLAIVACGANKPNPHGGSFYVQDSGAAIENLLLKAVELGLGCCWCGVAQGSERAEAVRRALGMDGLDPLALIAVGVPDEAPAARGFYEEGKVRFV
jgi:nitroreductase